VLRLLLRKALLLQPRSRSLTKRHLPPLELLHSVYVSSAGRSPLFLCGLFLALWTLIVPAKKLLVVKLLDLEKLSHSSPSTTAIIKVLMICSSCNPVTTSLNISSFYCFSSNIFLLLLPKSVLVNLFIFMYFQDDLECHYILVSQEVFIGYDQTITSGIEPVYLELVIPQVCPAYHHLISPCVAAYPTQYPYFSYTHLLNVLSFCTSVFYAIYHYKSNYRHV
jgi:hypothetical protein